MQQQEKIFWTRRDWLGVMAAGSVLAGSPLAVLQAGEAGLQAGGKEEPSEHPSQPPKKKKKVLIAIGEFSEALETYYMVYRLMEENLEPVVVGPAAKRLLLVVHDFDPQYTNYVEYKGYGIEARLTYQQVQPAEYAGLLIPGGRGPEQMRQIKEAVELVGYFLDKNLPVGAMCHGPQMVWAARPVKGRSMTCFPGIRADLELAGAKFVDAPVVVDDNLVTSQGWPDLPHFMPAFLKLLAGKKVKKKESKES
ncbi:MAG: DJ-1/PfpI family protein [Thermoguttaceae bacterium]|nr:DJ-1/PfpI family protein [Thermoguttaceae bacterium]MDW8039636.1 DJ-1/PfpI family protein [Thermoguttaceae bacterium]